MAEWLGAVLGLLKLVGFLVDLAKERQSEEVGRAVALTQVTKEVQLAVTDMVARASAARADARAHDAAPGGLLEDDGFKRD